LTKQPANVDLSINAKKKAVSPAPPAIERHSALENKKITNVLNSAQANQPFDLNDRD